MHLSIYPSIQPSIYLSFYLSVCLSIHLFMHLSIHLFIYSSIHLSSYQAIYISISLSIYLPICQSIYPSIFLAPKPPPATQKPPAERQGPRNTGEAPGLTSDPFAVRQVPRLPHKNHKGGGDQGTSEGRQRDARAYMYV